MKSKLRIKKIFLSKDLQPVLQTNTDGTIISYSNEKIVYELNYHYLFKRLIHITCKKQNETKTYNIIQIIAAKIEALLFFDKLLYIDYTKEDLMLVNLINNMLMY